jgi:hypothetical protein
MKPAAMYGIVCKTCSHGDLTVRRQDVPSISDNCSFCQIWDKNTVTQPTDVSSFFLSKTFFPEEAIR